MTSLGNKIAIVTGGGSGIGAAVAVKLAQEGAIVVIGEDFLPL
jgi:NAD(P)-dependent dehydrogenase (short-subunit alcohol dehydrogenase family)